MKLKFSPANAKTHKLALVPELQRYLAPKRKVYSLDLSSGYTCPYAEKCLSRAVVGPDGRAKIVDGPKTEFRCFSASQEVIYPAVRRSRQRNFDLLRQCKTTDATVQCIASSMPNNMGICRIHVAGDFFSQMYFDAWMDLAIFHPDILFYAYTKSLPYWIRRINVIPSNFILTASYGGRSDDLINAVGLRYAKVVLSESEADQLQLSIDHDDSHAAVPTWKNQSFALLIHGVQPKGSESAKALKALKGKGTYSR